MARIRTVKPEFWSSPSMRGANPWARLLFVAMWNWADDTGRGTANVRELAAFAFPDDEDPIAPTAAELPSLLAEVRGRWDVAFYEVGGRRYYAIPSWDDHQRNERRAQSRHPGPDTGTPYDPGPPEQDKRSELRKVAELPTQDRGTSDASDGSSVSGTGEQGNRGSTTSVTADAETHTEPPPPSRSREADEDAEFEAWWSAWPRKVAKGGARKAYRTARRKVTADLLMTAATNQAAAWKSTGKDAEFIPHATTWLNQERYNDEVERPKFTVITNPDSPWAGQRIDNSESPWASDMGWTS